MQALVVDDKQLAVNAVARILGELDPEGSCAGARNAQTALEIAQSYPPDVAFIDIEMPGTSGFELARQLMQLYPKLNVVFVTAHAEHALRAHGLFPSGFLLKPVTEKAVQEVLDHLRNPVEGAGQNVRVMVQCFGNFDVFCAGRPLRFKRRKTKELFAYLVDQRGARVSIGELIAVLWEDGSSTSSRRAQVRNMISDLRSALEDVGATDVICRNRDEIAVNLEAFDCDYYRYLNGDPLSRDQFQGRYMAQYSWAETTAASLISDDLR